MRIGLLRSRVTLQKRVPSTDGEGSSSDGWVTVGTIWAAVQSTAGVEVLEAAQPEARITHEVTIRYRSDLAPPLGHQARLLLGNRTLDISTAMDPDERRREMDLLCVERQH